ncbi:type VII secretion target [Hamadaea tsunoensis]|uniref:type VII secretion target n=1 Tax=Hamadaea tsunoensis TaxID=53368 RepID=UPI000406C988|nr:type VII secretion target [Hamadaea tsunoensis]
MSGLRRLAERLDRAAEQIAEVPAALARSEVTPFNDLSGAPGRLGDIGRDLRRQCAEAWQNRFDEATDAGRRIDRLADAVRDAATRYAATEQAVRAEHPDWGL